MYSKNDTATGDYEACRMCRFVWDFACVLNLAKFHVCVCVSQDVLSS
jgi:hypothetical protein